MSKNVRVKWGKKYYDVNINMAQDPLLFKTQIFSLTGVVPDRQKLVVKGIPIKDTWTGVELTDNCTILMMGSAEEVPVKPIEAENIKFSEDIKVAPKIIAGLINLGNTCFLNATIQCLKTVPELNIALDKCKTENNILLAMKELFILMDRLDSVSPIKLLFALKNVFPHLVVNNDKGTFEQQDANECWTELIKIFEILPAITKEGLITKKNNFVDQFFTGVFHIEYQCLDAQEPVTNSKETFSQLSCFITQEIKYLQTGLRSLLNENIEKFSPVLNRNAKYSKTLKISRLPAYLNVQFIRFYYKEKEKINAKILKEIKFPLVYDAYELCTPELQADLEPMRAKFQEEDDGKIQDLSILQQNLDSGANHSGYYSLQAILTHKGRSCSIGHYVAWVKYLNGWLRCDDDNITQVHEDDILKLSGGGDWHCSYVLLYGSRMFKSA